MRLVVALVLLALVTGCGGAPPERPDQSGRSMPTTLTRAVADGGGGTVSFATDWKAPFTGDHSRRHAVGCVRDLVVLGVHLEADLTLDGPDGASWQCAGVVESISWAGGGPIGVSAYVSTESAQRVQVARRTETTGQTARLDLLVLGWDDARRAWFASMRTDGPLEGRVVDTGGQPRVSIAEEPSRLAAGDDTQAFSLYVEIAPTSDRQTVTVATGVGRTFQKLFQD